MGQLTAHAWAEFYLAQRQVLTAYALALTGNEPDAQDLLQDVLARMVREGHPAVRDARAYVLRCLRNLAIDRRRAVVVRGVAEPLDEDEIAFLDTRGNQADCDENAEQLKAALRALSSEQREVIVLRIYCELSFREIAEVLAKPLGTVTSHYRRGLEELRLYCTSGDAHVSRGN
ncbi:MAG: sigma-70 family RNA polymerase sigma factor [Planctomycetota bacterium]